MFDLNKAIDDWCKKVADYGIWDSDKIDELKDHLHCVIEEDIEKGTSVQKAFENATNAMGYPAQKLNESSWRAGVVQSVCRVMSKIESSPHGDSPLVIMHSVIFASMMIASSLVVKDSDAGQSLLMIMLAGWFASFAALDGTKRSAKQEWLCLKSKVTKMLG